MHMQIVHNAYTPKETVELCSRAGVMKANMRIDKVFFSSFMAGCLLAFACAAVLVVNTAPWYQENAPGLIRMIAALIFPFGLVSIVTTGADLCTGSFMFTTISTLHRRTGPLKMLMHWTITFLGNLAGSLFIMGILVGFGGVFDTAPFKAEVVKFATSKAVTPEWHMIFLRGIGANWLVCLACFLAFQAREFFSRVIAIWWPTFAFVVLGFDHVVANMFFVPIGIWYDTPGLSTGYYIWKSMIPALIGNVLGGGLFVGVMYWYLYIAGDSTPVPIDGVTFGDTVPLMGQSSESPEYSQGRESPTPHDKSAENMV